MLYPIELGALVVFLDACRPDLPAGPGKRLKMRHYRPAAGGSQLLSPAVLPGAGDCRWRILISVRF